jgi:hypothetical protein
VGGFFHLFFIFDEQQQGTVLSSGGLDCHLSASRPTANAAVLSKLEVSPVLLVQMSIEFQDKTNGLFS